MSTARLQHAVGWGYAAGWALCLMLVTEPVFIAGSAWAQPGGGAGGMEAGGTAYYTFTVLRIFDIGRWADGAEEEPKEETKRHCWHRR